MIRNFMDRLCKRKHELCSVYGVDIYLCTDYVKITFVPLDYAMFAEFNPKLGYDSVVMDALWIDFS
jgi:hypothetical protein